MEAVAFGVNAYVVDRSQKEPDNTPHIDVINCQKMQIMVSGRAPYV